MQNKESRKLESDNAINEVLANGRICVKDLPSVLGRIQFADHHTFGCAGKLAVADIRDFAAGGAATVRMDSLMERSPAEKPRFFEADVPQKPCLVFH